MQDLLSPTKLVRKDKVDLLSPTRKDKVYAGLTVPYQIGWSVRTRSMQDLLSPTK